MSCCRNVKVRTRLGSNGRDKLYHGVCGDSTAASGETVLIPPFLATLTLQRRGSQAFGFRKLARKPKVGTAWRQDDFPLLQQDSTGYWWFPYPVSLNSQRSMQVEVRDVDVMLSKIVEDVLDFLYPEEGNLPPLADPERALNLYDALIDWKLSCPSRIRLEEAVLPSTILLQLVHMLRYRTRTGTNPPCHHLASAWKLPSQPFYAPSHT